MTRPGPPKWIWPRTTPKINRCWLPDALRLKLRTAEENGGSQTTPENWINTTSIFCSFLSYYNCLNKLYQDKISNTIHKFQQPPHPSTTTHIPDCWDIYIYPFGLCFIQNDLRLRQFKFTAKQWEADGSARQWKDLGYSNTIKFNFYFLILLTLK